MYESLGEVCRPRSGTVGGVEDGAGEGEGVKDFGAAGNGVADDTAKIASACVAAAAAGAVLYFPPGTYLFSQNDAFGPFYTGATTLHLVGAGPEVTILKNTHATGAGVRFASSYSSIAELSIDANGGAGVSLSIPGQGCYGRNVLIKNQTGAAFGFVANGCTLSDFENFTFSNCSNDVQLGPNPTDYVNFRQLVLGPCTGTCLNITAGTNIKFFGLYVEDAGTASIYISGSQQIDVYSLGAELASTNVLTGPAYIQIVGSQSVNFWGGRVQHSGTASTTLFKTSGASSGGVKVEGFYILSTQTGMTLFDLGAGTGFQIAMSVRDITTNLTATAVGVTNFGAVHGQVIENWRDRNAQCTYVLDATELMVVNVAGNIALTSRANQVLVNCDGTLSGTGLHTATLLGDSAQLATAAGNLAFYGVASITRQVLATGAAHSVDDVITFLQLIGLVKQA